MRSGPEERWRALWERLGAAGDPVPAWRDLERRYGEPHRAYHTLDHIAHALEEFEAVRGQAGSPDAVEWAIWYHDAVYDTHAFDNEERSAELALQAAARASVRPEVAAQAVRHILASRHREPPEDADGRLFVDADLAILGQPWDRFAAYEEGIRREYRWVPSWLFRRRRRALLRAFLARPFLYVTPHFRKKYETRARQNLERSLGLGVRR
jgi:predicted metal-dependent HD superfamily phosphohydrolase